MTQTKKIILKQYAIDKPQELIKMADLLKTHIVKNGLFTNIHGKNYAHVEGWQFGGFLLGLLPVIKSVENLSTDKVYKWRADVELHDKNDRVVSTGIAICSNQEAIKKSFDEYAVLSMAQTRAIGKAYRNLIGWIMKLAGYESTPSEEVTESVVKETEKAVKEEKVASDFLPKIKELMQVKDDKDLIQQINKVLGSKYQKMPKDLQRLYARLLQTKNQKNGN